MSNEKGKENEYLEVVAKDGEWSEWMLPPPDNPIKSSCCDCNLVHDYEFGTVNMRRAKGGEIKIKHLNSERVVFRTRVNRSETNRLRNEG